MLFRSKTFFLFFVLTSSALAQPIGVGIKAGVPLTDALTLKPSTTLQYLQDTHRFTVGPYVELHLPAHLVIEIDALYRSYEFQRVIPSAAKQSVSSWEFPVLGKYKLFGGPIQPYIEGGVAFSRLSDIPSITELQHRNNRPLVVADHPQGFLVGLARFVDLDLIELQALHPGVDDHGGRAEARGEAAHIHPMRAHRREAG